LENKGELKMCEPTTILAATAAMSAYSGFQQAEAHNQAAEYNAKILERNAQIADMQAKRVGVLGLKAERRVRKETSGLKGTQRAKFASSGVLVDRGTSFDILSETTDVGEQDALSIRHNTALDVWGLNLQSQDYRSQAELSRRQKRNTLFSGALAGGQTYLTGKSLFGGG